TRERIYDSIELGEHRVASIVHDATAVAFGSDGYLVEVLAERSVSGVLVVGGGVAGLAAATRLAEAGHRPTLFEARKSLGGRAASLLDPATGHRVDNGQHLLMGCNRSVRRLLERIGAADGVTWQPRLDLAFASASHGPVRLRLPPLPGSLAALGGLLTTRGLAWADRTGAARALRAFLRGGPELAGQTVAHVLDRLETPPAARAHLLEPLALATLNDRPHRALASALAAVIREAFGGGPAAAGLGLPRRDLDQLFGRPAHRFIEAHGGRVEMQQPVETIVVGDRGVEGVVLARGEARPARAVVAAVPPWALASLVPAEARPEGLEGLPESPIVSATFWLDRPVIDELLVGLVGTTAQWVFNRTGLLGLQSPGQVVAVTVSAADELVPTPKADIVETLMDDLRRLVPAARDARLEHAVVVKERRATVALRPGESHTRPGARTAVAGLYLAGGWTATGLPDTLEGAARSGEGAAAALLADGLLGPP
ncbi:MAG: hydroxysqualene dehydroxylase HpnE, partial [Candidatus Tectimicrobiota bacterium]